MKLFWAIILLVIPATIWSQSFDFESERLNCTFSYPDGWLIDSTLSHRVTIVDSTDERILISIGRYDIPRENFIKSARELYEAIGGLYEDLGIDVSNNEITYTINRGRADFEIGYRQYEPSESMYYQKYLNGFVIKTAAKTQLFYLIIAQAPEDIYQTVMPGIEIVFNSFKTTEQLSNSLYSKSDMLPYLLILLIMALIAFFFARNRRIQKSKNPLGRDSSSFWRCSDCGRTNHVELTHCNRCGNERNELNSVR